MRLLHLNILADACCQFHLGCALESGAAGSASVVVDSQVQVVRRTLL